MLLKSLRGQKKASFVKSPDKMENILQLEMTKCGADHTLVHKKNQTKKKVRVS